MSFSLKDVLHVTRSPIHVGLTFLAMAAVALAQTPAPPVISKQFSGVPSPFYPGQTATLTITISNPNVSPGPGLLAPKLTVSFDDVLPAGLVVATPNGINGTCTGFMSGSTGATAGSNHVSETSTQLAGGNVSGLNGSQCTVIVNVLATGAATGVLTNSTSVTSVEGGVGNTATAQVTVVGPPHLTKTFGVPVVPVGGTTTLTFTIANPNATLALTGVGFTDTLPAGLVVTTPSGLTGTCIGGMMAASGNSVSLTGASLPAGTSCLLSVNVEGTADGMKNNITSQITSVEVGNGGPATASILVADPPQIAKAFGVLGLPGGSTSLMFSLTNPNSVVTLTGLAFSDTLPTGLLVSSPNGLVGSCGGGTITATAGSNIVTLANASLAAGASCTFTVNVTAAAFELGLLTNTTSTVTSNEALPGAAASASIFVGNPFQVHSASNLAIGDSVVNITDTGTSSTTAFPTQNGNICVNVYTFSPDEQLISCCSCPVTPDGLDSLSARNDLISDTLTPGVPTSIVLKLLASTGAPACNASTVGTGANVLATGLAAWGTTIHALPVTPGSPATTYGVTETAFRPSTLSAAELTRITTLCGFIQTNGSGFGICKSCRLGGLANTQ